MSAASSDELPPAIGSYIGCALSYYPHLQTQLPDKCIDPTRLDLLISKKFLDHSGVSARSIG